MSAELVERTLRFELHTFWHPGTGRGDGALADAAVHKTAEGLPFLPGRTVKGLLRDAAELAVAAGLLAAPDVLALFGSPLPDGIDADNRVGALEEARYASVPGTLWFSSACLGRTRDEQIAWRAWARHREQAPDQHAQQQPGVDRTARAGAPDRKEPSDLLFQRFASTRIDASGIARDHTLRTIEIVVPVDLHAFVRGRPDTPWDALDQAARLFIRGVGSHRHRGLGRVSASVGAA